MSSNDCADNLDEKTEPIAHCLSHHVKWFWTGYSMPAEPKRLAFAKGSSVSMLAAAEFVLKYISWLRTPECQIDHQRFETSSTRVTERGTWSECQTAVHLLERASRELSDDLPHIVPLRIGNGILYATGPTLGEGEWEELKYLAGLPVELGAANE